MPSDWDASTYDRVSDPQYRWASVVVERLEPGASTILDAGCGSGRVTQLLLERFPEARVIGVDASEAMIAEARRRLAPLGDRVTLARGDLTEPLPIHGTVDAIFSNAVFHWIDDHEKLFANLATVLRPGGQLVAQWGGYGNVAGVLAAANELGPDLGNKHFVTPEETIPRLEAAGFEGIHVWLHDDPADFETDDALEEYLRTVCVRCHLDLLPPEERDGFVKGVADRLPGRRIDYVRLNATARRG